MQKDGDQIQTHSVKSSLGSNPESCSFPKDIPLKKRNRYGRTLYMEGRVICVLRRGRAYKG